MLYNDKPSKKEKPLKSKAVSKKSAPRTRKRTPQKSAPKSSSLLFKLFTGAIITLFIVVGIKYLMDNTLNHNPLLGKWRTQTALGVMEIEFERNSMSTFGTKNSVTYDIEENKIIVFDDMIKVGNTYKIIDDNTISTEVGGYKTVYKRVK